MTGQVMRLTQARKAAEELLDRKVLDGTMAAGTAHALATAGFLSATRILAELRASGMSEECITESFTRQLHRGQEAGDQHVVNAAEFTLAVWDGMLADLAEWTKMDGTEQR